MKFGRLADTSQVDFTLPPDHPATEVVLENLSHHSQPLEVYVGATGWGMPVWKGKWYPPKAQPSEFLHFFGKQFNTIELNTTHYRIPTPDMVEKWCASVPDDFRFCPKIPQVISHSNNLGLTSSSLDLFIDAAYHFGQNMGCIFMQLPPYFDRKRFPQLETFLAQWPADLPLAIELRHEDWFSDENNTDEVAEVLQKGNHPFVISDVAGRRDVIHQRLTSDVAMIRFNGNGLIDSDFTRINDWVDRLAKWWKGGLKRVYFFTHEPDNVLAPELADYTWKTFNGKIPVKGRGPQARENPRQMELF